MARAYEHGPQRTVRLTRRGLAALELAEWRDQQIRFARLRTWFELVCAASRKGDT